MDELDLDGDDATRPPMKHLPGLATEPSGDIPSPFRSRMSQRTRVLRLMGISVLLLLALAIPLASLPPTQRLVANVLHPATPTATPLYPPGVYPIWYINSVPWGVLRIDGRTGIRLTGVATLSGSTYQPPVFKLGKGRHTIRYDAPPYPPLNCTLSVPAAPGDTCPTGGGGLDLQASPEHL
ncbi:MAG TPA: hypothetical protein VGR57_00935, partial [Ktedonobacterales bacterium]|nr:hypothetical protein [Ktedonobacterales bacterium]